MTVADIIKRAMLAGLGAQEKAKEFVDELVKAGELSKSDASSLVKEWVSKAEDSRKEFDNKIKDAHGGLLRKTEHPDPRRYRKDGEEAPEHLRTAGQARERRREGRGVAQASPKRPCPCSASGEDITGTSRGSGRSSWSRPGMGSAILLSSSGCSGLFPSAGACSRSGRAPSPEHRSAPERLRLMFEELGPSFIKFGQVLSCRPDLLPVEYARELCKLTDSVSPFPFPAGKRDHRTRSRRAL